MLDIQGEEAFGIINSVEDFLTAIDKANCSTQDLIDLFSTAFDYEHDAASAKLVMAAHAMGEAGAQRKKASTRRYLHSGDPHRRLECKR